MTKANRSRGSNSVMAAITAEIPVLDGAVGWLVCVARPGCPGLIISIALVMMVRTAQARSPIPEAGVP